MSIEKLIWYLNQLNIVHSFYLLNFHFDIRCHLYDNQYIFFLINSTCTSLKIHLFYRHTTSILSECLQNFFHQIKHNCKELFACFSLEVAILGIHYFNAPKKCIPLPPKLHAFLRIGSFKSTILFCDCARVNTILAFEGVIILSAALYCFWLIQHYTWLDRQFYMIGTNKTTFVGDCKIIKMHVATMLIMNRCWIHDLHKRLEQLCCTKWLIQNHVQLKTWMCVSWFLQCQSMKYLSNKNKKKGNFFFVFVSKLWKWYECTKAWYIHVFSQN